MRPPILCPKNKKGDPKRPFLRPDYSVIMKKLPWCSCKDQPPVPGGAVCGKCGGAIDLP